MLAGGGASRNRSAALAKEQLGPGETIANELCGRTCIVMPPRRFNQDLRFSEVSEDLTVEQFIAQGAVE